ncbi:hypothetical protein EYF80_006484 [Liparis tanakae]|uniref:Uncharacterized protein n=1 Tax=Liparis tanakae TaxID=230148 RepID=A0A4Z2J215_9TELE|nr:hypothetical protein EYF80_006484 [Liparis tanakae]
MTEYLGSIFGFSILMKDFDMRTGAGDQSRQSRRASLDPAVPVSVHSGYSGADCGSGGRAGSLLIKKV